MTICLFTTDATRAIRKAMLVICLAITFCLPAKALTNDIQVMAGEPEGWPVVTIGGGNAMMSHFAFWGGNWQWDSIKSEFKNVGPFQYAVSSEGSLLGLNIKDHISRISEKKLRWAIDIEAKKLLTDVVGGGVVFNFDLDTYRSVLGEPALLPNNQGWIWGRGTKNQIEMRFEPALVSVFFERNRTNEIRAYFYSQSIPAGMRHYMVTLTVSGDAAIVPTRSERAGVEDIDKWVKQEIDWKGSPVDLSFLNDAEIPAGKHGFLKAIGEKLVFKDGTPIRFWGTNLTAYALFGTPKEEVRQQAKRLSQLGFNLVRFHHHDSPWVNPNIFGNQQATQANKLDPAMLDKLDWWIKCLKDEGIYVWLDMHAQRFLNKGDSITAFDEISQGKPTADLKGYNYVNPSIQQSMKDFSAAYLNHVNHYTGLAYKDEPAIAAILITNENDITSHFGNALLPDKNVPWHDEQYMREAKRFAAKSGLNAERVWRSWEPGSAKYFLNDLEYRFNTDMIAYLHGIGVKVPIVTTNTWGENPLSSLPALTAGDMIDVHSYGGVGELEINPMFSANMMDWLAAGQVNGKPMAVSEWNVSPYPVSDRSNTPLYIAAVASHQGWDAVMQYAYAQESITGAGSPSNWHSYNDPALLATLPAAALMYRQGHVREAITTYAFESEKERFFGQNISPANAVVLRIAAELGKLTIAMPQSSELPWLKQSQISAGTKVITDSGQSFLPPGATEATSDTGELKRNWAKGIYTIDTPYIQAAMGWIGGQKQVLSDVEITVENKNATLSVQTLDGKPIKSSKRIYISVMARSQISQNDHKYFYAEPIAAVVRIAAPRGLKLIAANRSNQLPVSYSGGYYQLDLKGAQSAYLLTNVIPVDAHEGLKPTVAEKLHRLPAPDGGNPYKLNLRVTQSEYLLKNVDKSKAGGQ